MDDKKCARRNCRRTAHNPKQNWCSHQCASADLHIRRACLLADMFGPSDLTDRYLMFASNLNKAIDESNRAFNDIKRLALSECGISKDAWQELIHVEVK